MKRILIVLAILTGTATLKAQTAADSVKAVINQFFDGMRNVDVSMVTGSFADSAILQTVVNRQGKVSVRNEPLSGFANVITRKTNKLKEEMKQIQIQLIDVPVDMTSDMTKEELDEYFNSRKVEKKYRLRKK